MIKHSVFGQNVFFAEIFLRKFFCGNFFAEIFAEIFCENSSEFIEILIFKEK